MQEDGDPPQPPCFLLPWHLEGGDVAINMKTVMFFKESHLVQSSLLVGSLPSHNHSITSNPRVLSGSHRLTSG